MCNTISAVCSRDIITPMRFSGKYFLCFFFFRFPLPFGDRMNVMTFRPESRVHCDSAIYRSSYYYYYYECKKEWNLWLHHKITNSCYQTNGKCLLSAFWLILSTILPHILERGQYTINTKVMIFSVELTGKGKIH